VQLDASQGGPESGGGRFQWATPDSEKAFFTDDRRLTAEAKAQAGKPDLYEYDLSRPQGERLVDLTAGTGEAAGVQGLSGISTDGSYVYFVAEADLRSEAGQRNSHGDEPQKGKPNLYLRHGDVTTFIARLNAYKEDRTETTLAIFGDYCDWESSSPPGEFQPTHPNKANNCLSARVSGSGRFLAFNSLRELTGYRNVVEATGGRDNEVYLYDAAAKELSCVSCVGTPTRDKIPLEESRLESLMIKEQWRQTQGYLMRQLTEDGSVFFDAKGALLPGAMNGKVNVYEYNAGQLYLISTGTSLDDSYFRDATPSGGDVFFITTQALVGRDTDNRMSLYDARVEGGFPEPPVVSAPCGGGSECRGAPGTPPPLPAPLSAVLQPAVGAPAFQRVTVAAKPKARVCRRGFARVRLHRKRVCMRTRGHRAQKKSGSRRGRRR
jgi:hypothetical protein